MTPGEMAIAAAIAMQGGTRMTMVLPRPWRNRPPKFPRGELLCENSDGRNVYSFDPMRVLAWLAANGLVKVETKVQK
jgi:predicted ATP-grasp superfamily ATP-dependent carboligase